MHRVGTVERVAQGLAVARSPGDSVGPPDIGVEVVDESLDVVGRIVSVFGPVDRPYVAVTPDDRDAGTLFDEALYVR